MAVGSSESLTLAPSAVTTLVEGSCRWELKESGVYRGRIRPMRGVVWPMSGIV